MDAYLICFQGRVIFFFYELRMHTQVQLLNSMCIGICWLDRKKDPKNKQGQKSKQASRDLYPALHLSF